LYKRKIHEDDEDALEEVDPPDQEDEDWEVVKELPLPLALCAPRRRPFVLYESAAGCNTALPPLMVQREVEF